MTVSIRSAVLVGLDSVPVTVTATKHTGPLKINGLPDAAMREIRVRVQSALARYNIVADGVDVQISPEVTHGTAGLDLAIALAIAGTKRDGIQAANSIAVVIGELNLDGQTRAVRGVIAHARAAGRTLLIVPSVSAHTAAVADASVLACESLGRLLADKCQPVQPTSLDSANDTYDISEIRHAATRRALEIAAAGELPLLLIGPPGCGKTMAARRLTSIMPHMSHAERLDVALIDNAAVGWRVGDGAIQRPFRAPHYTVSEMGLMGGGQGLRPGEMTLAHNGVLFLDELSEFRGECLDAIALALDDREVKVRHRDTRVVFPARALLVGARNQCGCGHLGSSRQCTCRPDRLARWHEWAKKRYDSMFAMHVVMPESSTDAQSHESSATVRKRVTAARAQVTSVDVLPLDPRAEQILSALHVGVHRHTVMRIAQTIAVLGRSRTVQPAHMTEAIGLHVGVGGE
jgi:magnesium chelatase family protein